MVKNFKAPLFASAPQQVFVNNPLQYIRAVLYAIM